jgi:hypothetical protein
VAAEYPSISTQGALSKAFAQFRKSFPATLDAATLKKFAIAPANESYVINTFRFLGFIDSEGKRIDDAVGHFFGSDTAFAKSMEAVLTEKYKALFDDFGDETWTKDRSALATWFRVTDKSSQVVGGRQASTFQTLAALAGHGDVPAPTASSAKTNPGGSSGKSNAPKPASPAATPKAQTATPKVPAKTGGTGEPVSLTVRIEVNLPAGATPKEYDAMFESIRKHLIDRG